MRLKKIKFWGQEGPFCGVLHHPKIKPGYGPDYSKKEYPPPPLLPLILKYIHCSLLCKTPFFKNQIKPLNLTDTSHTCITTLSRSYKEQCSTLPNIYAGNFLLQAPTEMNNCVQILSLLISEVVTSH